MHASNNWELWVYSLSALFNICYAVVTFTKYTWLKKKEQVPELPYVNPFSVAISLSVIIAIPILNTGMALYAIYTTIKLELKTRRTMRNLHHAANIKRREIDFEYLLRESNK